MNVPPPFKPGKKFEAEISAKRIYAKLMALKPKELSQRQWLMRAGVSQAFFTNMSGFSKPPSEPTISNLRLLLSVLGITLSEFFSDEPRPQKDGLMPTGKRFEVRGIDSHGDVHLFGTDYEDMARQMAQVMRRDFVDVALIDKGPLA